MSPSRFWPCTSKPNGPSAVGAAGAEASALNCGAASSGRAKGAGLSALEEVRGDRTRG